MIEGVERDLAELAERDPRLACSALAQTALALAAAIDDPESSATSKSLCAKELRETLNVLRQIAPAVQTEDRVDDLSARRQRRLARRATSKG